MRRLLQRAPGYAQWATGELAEKINKQRDNVVRVSCGTNCHVGEGNGPVVFVLVLVLVLVLHKTHS